LWITTVHKSETVDLIVASHYYLGHLRSNTSSASGGSDYPHYDRIHLTGEMRDAPPGWKTNIYTYIDVLESTNFS
jgi:hypothetical protein